MTLLDRINRTGTTVVMATHDAGIVDNMRRRVIELDHGSVIRDQARGDLRPRPGHLVPRGPCRRRGGVVPVRRTGVRGRDRADHVAARKRSGRGRGRR